MLRTTTTGIALACTLALAGLTGCQQERAPEPASRSVAPTPSTDVPPPALATTDPSLPPRGTQPSPETKADATAHSELTKAERDKAMPLEGQANNYNSDVAAKRGDENIPREQPPGNATAK